MMPLPPFPDPSRTSHLRRSFGDWNPRLLLRHLELADGIFCESIPNQKMQKLKNIYIERPSLRIERGS